MNKTFSFTHLLFLHRFWVVRCTPLITSWVEYRSCTIMESHTPLCAMILRECLRYCTGCLTCRRYAEHTVTCNPENVISSLTVLFSFRISRVLCQCSVLKIPSIGQWSLFLPRHLMTHAGCSRDVPVRVSRCCNPRPHYMFSSIDNICRMIFIMDPLICTSFVSAFL